VARDYSHFRKKRGPRSAEVKAKIGAGVSKHWANKTKAERKAHARKILLGMLRNAVETNANG
jgi:hypothetical protein